MIDVRKIRSWFHRPTKVHGTKRIYSRKNKHKEIEEELLLEEEEDENLLENLNNMRTNKNNKWTDF